MPDRIIQLKSGKIVSYDGNPTDGIKNIQLWKQESISIKILSEDEILDFSAQVATPESGKILNLSELRKH